MKINKKILFSLVALGCEIKSVVGTVKKNNERHIYCVVLAGGTGERLWPLSTKKKPKQFLTLGGNKSLLEETFERVIAVRGIKHNWVVTTEDLQPLVKSTMKDTIEHIIVEPAARNTGPAILLTLMEIALRNPEAYVVFLPADHFIPDSMAFSHALNIALDHGTQGITLLGIKPRYPATGYGYIKTGTISASQMVPVAVNGFFEKPTQSNAEKYIASGNMLWNAGIFCGQVKDFIGEYKIHAPSIYKKIQRVVRHKSDYKSLPSISIDYAILEKSKNISVLPVTFEWSDIGNLSIYLALRKKKSDVHASTIFEIDSKNCLVHSQKKVVALVDVQDICVIETDDVLLITSKNNAEKVKKVVANVRENSKFNDLL